MSETNETRAKRLGEQRAHPIEGVREYGLTKRELFAAMAMQGILANASLGIKEHDVIALMSMEHADALLAELARPEQAAVEKEGDGYRYFREGGPEGVLFRFKDGQKRAAIINLDGGEIDKGDKWGPSLLKAEIILANIEGRYIETTPTGQPLEGGKK